MKSLVIYTTTSGNTRVIAEAIADALRDRGSVDLMTADEAPGAPSGTDLVVVGGPTERHGLTPPMAGFLDRLTPGAFNGTAAAAFDTRLRWPRLLSGSAAEQISKRLKAAGAAVLVPPESFMVTTKPQLEPGEAARAAAWASSLAEAVERSAPVLR